MFLLSPLGLGCLQLKVVYRMSPKWYILGKLILNPFKIKKSLEFHIWIDFRRNKGNNIIHKMKSKTSMKIKSQSMSCQRNATALPKHSPPPSLPPSVSLSTSTPINLEKLNIDLFQRNGFKSNLIKSILALKDLNYTRNG